MYQKNSQLDRQNLRSSILLSIDSRTAIRAEPDLGREAPRRASRTDNLRKIHIIGDAGSGKCTLANVVGSVSSTSVLHLDDVQYGENWASKSGAEVQRIVAEFQLQESWVTEGNLPQGSEFLVRSADLVIWVDTPFSISTVRLARRVWSDYRNCRPVCGSNADSFGRLLHPWNSCLAKKIRKHRRKRREFKKLIRNVPHVVLLNDDDCFAFLWFNYESVRRMKPRSYQDILKEVNREH